MNAMRSRWTGIALCAGLALAAAGCDQRSAETAGQKLDRTAQDVATTTKDAATKTAAALDDGAITAKVKAAIFAEPGLKALQIDVDTKDSVVTLSGNVDTPALRERAVRLASSLDGVRQVVDKLAVKS